MNALEVYRGIAYQYPLHALFFLLGKPGLLHRAMILQAATFLFGRRFDSTSWKTALRELEAGDLVPMNPVPNTARTVGNSASYTLGKWLYCAVRALRPESIVETGVSHGASSWIILNALHKNGHGRLYSIDLPNHDTNFNYNFSNGLLQTGWVVPETLRSRWQLLLGSSRELLPPLLAKLDEIDMFFHDSDHSYENMKFEFAQVLPFLKKYGLIISDDVQKNFAFSEFAKEERLRAILFRKGGALVKWDGD